MDSTTRRSRTSSRSPSPQSNATGGPPCAASAGPQSQEPLPPLPNIAPPPPVPVAPSPMPPPAPVLPPPRSSVAPGAAPAPSPPPPTYPPPPLPPTPLPPPASPLPSAEDLAACAAVSLPAELTPSRPDSSLQTHLPMTDLGTRKAEDVAPEEIRHHTPKRIRASSPPLALSPASPSAPPATTALTLPHPASPTGSHSSTPPRPTMSNEEFLATVRAHTAAWAARLAAEDAALSAPTPPPTVNDPGLILHANHLTPTYPYGFPEPSHTPLSPRSPAQYALDPLLVLQAYEASHPLPRVLITDPVPLPPAPQQGTPPSALAGGSGSLGAAGTGEEAQTHHSPGSAPPLPDPSPILAALVTTDPHGRSRTPHRDL